MKMILANIDNGTQLAAPAFTVGTIGGTFGTQGTFYHYAVCPQTQTINQTPVFCGEALWGTLMMSGTLGTSAILQWTPQSGASNYVVYKGTANGTFGTYLRGHAFLSGTLGTWIDTAINTVGTGSALGSFNTAYTVAVQLPIPTGYNGGFNPNLLQHELINGNTIILDRGNKYNATIDFQQIGSTDKQDLMTAFNWRSNLRFYPNMTNSPSIYFDCAWTGNFNFPFVYSNINGGYNGNIQLKGIVGISQISEVI